MTTTSAARPRPGVLHAHARELLLLTAVVALALGMGVVTGGRFLSGENLRDVAVNACIPLVAATGMTVLIIAAQIDISVGAVMAVCAVWLAALANRGWGIPALVPLAALFGAAFGAINGLLTAYLRIPSIVATLATLGALRGLLVLVTRGNSISVPPSLTGLGTGTILGAPVLIWAAALAAVGGGLYLARTRLGREHYAVGSNPRAAELTGIGVAGVTFRSFLIVGALTGLAGLLFACRFTPIYPTPPRGFELEVITAVVVGGTDIFGGRGTVAGTVVAAVLLSVINTSLTFLSSIVSLPSETQPAVQGLLILAAVLANSLWRRGSD